MAAVPASPIYPLTPDEFMKLVEAGAFGGARVELIRGVVRFKLPQNRLHIFALRLVETAFWPFRQEGFESFGQATLRVPPHSLPDPDLYVARIDPKTAKEAPSARDALLVLEVSDSTLREDRREKGPLYAEAGIPEYWIVDVNGRRVEVYREPGAEGYASVTFFGEGESVAPLFANRQILVSDLLPEA